MEYQDLRDWIQIAEEMGELKTLKGCDWNLEIGAITEIVAHKEDGPAVLFDQQRPPAALGRLRRGNQARRASADHNNVIVSVQGSMFQGQRCGTLGRQPL